MQSSRRLQSVKKYNDRFGEKQQKSVIQNRQNQSSDFVKFVKNEAVQNDWEVI